MNKSLKHVTLKRGCTGIISLEIFQVNIFQIHVTQRLVYCLMGKKYEAFHLKIGNVFFLQEVSLVYPALTTFTQEKNICG